MIRLFLNVCKTFQKMKHLNFNDYDLYLCLSAGSQTDSFSCPSCKGPDEMLIVNVNIKMFKKWKIKMYSFPTFIPQLVPLYRLAFL